MSALSSSSSSCHRCVFVFTSAVRGFLARLHQDSRARALIPAWALALLANHFAPRHQVSPLSTGLRRNKADASAKVFLAKRALAARASSEESHETGDEATLILCSLWVVRASQRLETRVSLSATSHLYYLTLYIMAPKNMAVYVNYVCLCVCTACHYMWFTAYGNTLACPSINKIKQKCSFSHIFFNQNHINAQCKFHCICSLLHHHSFSILFTFYSMFLQYLTYCPVFCFVFFCVFFLYVLFPIFHIN